ncbi:MAG: sarcosine oxidase subunit delta [Pseudomonadota bacterium]
MLLITCPYCGPRDQSEFSYAGEAGLSLPKYPDSLSDEEWADYLFYRKNPKGQHDELWVHSAGCRRYFKARRDTVTYLFSGTCKMHESLDAD